MFGSCNVEEDVVYFNNFLRNALSDGCVVKDLRVTEGGITTVAHKNFGALIMYFTVSVNSLLSVLCELYQLLWVLEPISIHL